MPLPLGPLLGAGKVAEVFAYGGMALKLYRPGESKASAFREAAALKGVGMKRFQVAGHTDAEPLTPETKKKSAPVKASASKACRRRKLRGDLI